jgi:hypothetical protein
MKYQVRFIWKEDAEHEETVDAEYVIEAKSSKQAVTEAKRIRSSETLIKVRPLKNLAASLIELARGK